MFINTNVLIIYSAKGNEERPKLSLSYYVPACASSIGHGRYGICFDWLQSRKWRVQPFHTADAAYRYKGNVETRPLGAA